MPNNSVQFIFLVVRERFLAEIILPCSSVLRFGKADCLLMPPASKQCSALGLPSHHDSKLSNKAQCLLFTLQKSILSDTANKKFTSWQRWEDFYVSSFLLSSCIWRHLCPSVPLPLLGSSTLCTVLPLEDLVEDFMRGSWCDFSPSFGIAHRKWCSLVVCFLSVYSLACVHLCKELTLFLAASNKALIQPTPTLVRLTWNE